MQEFPLLEIVHVLLEFLVGPLCWVIWTLNKSVSELRVTIHRDFASKSDLDREVKRLDRETETLRKTIDFGAKRLQI